MVPGEAVSQQFLSDQVMIRLTETSQVDDARLAVLYSAHRHAALIPGDARG